MGDFFFCFICANFAAFDKSGSSTHLVWSKGLLRFCCLLRTQSQIDDYFPPWTCAVPWPDVIADAVPEGQRFFDVVSQANSAGCARIITASGLGLIM